MAEVNVAHATRRSVLCVPADDDYKVSKALASAADEVVIDLEDAVAYSEKDRARDQLASREWDAIDANRHVSIRANAAGTQWCHRDLEVATRIPHVTSVILPKVESRADLGFAERLLDGLETECGRTTPLTLQALIETAAGIVGLPDIVRNVERLTSLILGYADLAASLGRARDANMSQWRSIQDAVVLHARVGGVAAVDGPYLGVADDGPFQEAVSTAAALGFDAKWAIHPRQVDRINTGFTPSAQVVDHAQRVLAALEEAAATGLGAGVVDGALVDEAMAKDAKRVLAKAGPQ